MLLSQSLHCPTCGDSTSKPVLREAAGQNLLLDVKKLSKNADHPPPKLIVLGSSLRLFYSSRHTHAYNGVCHLSKLSRGRLVVSIMSIINYCKTRQLKWMDAVAKWRNTGPAEQGRLGRP